MNSKFTPPDAETDALCAQLTESMARNEPGKVLLAGALAHLTTDAERSLGIALTTEQSASQVNEYLDVVDKNPDLAKLLAAITCEAVEAAGAGETVDPEVVFSRAVGRLEATIGDDGAQRCLRAMAMFNEMSTE